ncbi:AIR carboxylase family protein [Candidatus Parcubacteria bacterium]|nr:AIR carboxylase family protein [Candidatus Parcubacteria bacterium]
MTTVATGPEASARAGGLVLSEGKTKIIAKREGDTDDVNIISKDDITAGDGAKHDIIPGKGAWATRTTCNVFRLLRACGIPVAFIEQVNETTFSAPLCKMLPYEVVIRREAHGSYLKREPHLRKGHHFPKLVWEFFLKTSGKKWKQHDLPCDDPFMGPVVGSDNIALYDPAKPMRGQEPFLTLREDEVFGYPEEWKLFEKMINMARRTFLILEKAWQLEGRVLVDFKVEFGLNQHGGLLLADVIDNDSWRVLENGSYIDKQVYREGGDLSDVAEKYRRVADATDRFNLPVQQIIIWCGSSKDDVAPLIDGIREFGIAAISSGEYVKVRRVVCSIHKEPVRGLDELQRLTHEIPDAVVIAYIGRSNGAGPTLSASTTIPVITVPAGYKDFPDDVWSSLRTPSRVPVMTVLEPSNAAMAALEILALRSPLVYMLLRDKLEETLLNKAWA